jgi:hypothetical protein
MNYYILPKNSINGQINFTFTKHNLLKPSTSKSAIHFLKNIHSQIAKINNNHDLNVISKVVNPYEFIFTNVPGTLLSVSKVKPESNVFFELLELYIVCNINENINKSEMLHYHITPNSTSSTYMFNIIREDYRDIHISENFDISKLYEKFLLNKLNFKINCFFFELLKEDYEDTNKYIINMIFIYYIIMKNQKEDGISIIKINDIFYKGIIDIIYLLSSVFEKTYIIKPLVSNIISSERYIVCKKYIPNNNSVNLNKIEEFLYRIINTGFESESGLRDYVVESIIDNEIPYLFMNKIEESSIVIAQQQLEALDHMINILKNKNKDEKIESLKRNHIQKSIQWCEKYKIPHNKFIEKLNIFLNNNSSNKNTKDLNQDLDLDKDLDEDLDLDKDLDQDLDQDLDKDLFTKNEDINEIESFQELIK